MPRVKAHGHSIEMFSLTVDIELQTKAVVHSPKQILAPNIKFHLPQLTSFTPWGHKAPLIVLLWVFLCFSPLYAKGKGYCVCMLMCECVHMLVPISPSSLLSLSTHIQMSLHLFCKCLPVCVICECTCVFTCTCLCAPLLFILCVCTYRWVYFAESNRVRGCVWPDRDAG